MERQVLILTFLISCIACSTKHEEVKYYPNGKIKSRITLNQEGRKDGTLTEYFEDGLIKSEGEWKEGKLNGYVRTYYSNGKLWSTSIYRNDTIIGETQFFFSDGRILERQLYKDGKLFYFQRYDSLGNIFDESILPLFYPEKDTVKIGEYYNVEVGFGYELSGSIKMYVGELDSEYNLIDTFEVFLPDKRNRFKYSILAKNRGKNFISMAFEHEPDKHDSLSVDGFAVKHTYFVK